jgi:stage III sporulation protein AH
MKSKIFKRNAIILTVIMFVCVAVYLNWTYGGAGEKAAETVKAQTGETADAGLFYVDESAEPSMPTEAQINDYFATARLTRQQARDSAVGALCEALGLETVSQEAKDKTLGEIADLAQASMTEAEIETLVMAKGFTECVAFLSSDSLIVAVPAPPEGLSTASVSRITDIALSETGLSTEQIKIIEVK